MLQRTCGPNWPSICHALVRGQDEKSHLALLCLTTGHAFGWSRVSVVGNGSTKRNWEFIEARNTILAWVSQCTVIDLYYKALQK